MYNNTEQLTPEFKETVRNWIDENTNKISEWHQKIWHFAEPAFREYKSARWYVELLTEYGFDVEAGSGDMPTAFAARWSNGEGPVVAAYAEYDAVPGNCQAATTHQAPRKGLSRFAAGHTDPHSALGIGSLTGLLATQAAMIKHNIAGTLVYFGEPAEKVRASKPYHAAKGYYDGIDAFLSFHPCYMLPLSNTTRWDTHCGPAFSVVYSFECTQPETWLNTGEGSPIAASHSSARAPGAMTALTMMQTLTESTRANMQANTGHWSLSEAILACPQATADNLPHHVAQIQYLCRVPSLEMGETIMQVLNKNAQLAAEAAHCTVEEIGVTKSRPGLANHVMAQLTYDNLVEAGAPKMDSAAIKVAQEIQANLGLEPMASPFMEAVSTCISPQDAERELRKMLPEWQTHFTSDDYTEMCWHAPTVRLYVGRPMLKAPKGVTYPAWVLNALGGIPECIDPMIFSAGKTIAGTMIDLLTQPSVLAAAQEEFKQRTGGGIGGSQWMAPMLPADFTPPTYLKWPEYITTARGEEWCIPTAPNDHA
ncbi:aminobenzoyl-glutamate utilization protein B [Colwellia chukchiensis]|uniref:Aminobenzoyl-glutamate utilization protein B n=1 Tax=Colwellia chukchiensis TaxID=641665 RepID=A0A1H7GW60_9GAMM|nr:peptidase M20 [Colwellia chukchiensis]SEK42321.1 aminobenzoyl-glutamate utilization protein B [Colwellia chukchiensis]